MAVATDRALAPFQDVLDVLAPYDAHNYHRLVPTAMQQRSPLYAPAVQVVKVDAEDPRAVYPTPGARDGTLCLHTQELEKIGNAVGIDFGRTHYERHEQYHVTAHVPFEVIDALGQRRRGHASKTVDLRDGSIQSRILGNGLQTARQFINERAEAGARSRVVKKWTGMPTSFKKDELAKPFVALRWTLDVNQPDVRKALIDAATRTSTEVFGGEGEPLVIEAGDDDDERLPNRDEAITTTAHVVEAASEPDEPEIPDEKPAAPASQDITAITVAMQQRARAIAGQQGRASDDQLNALATPVLRELLASRGKLEKEDLTLIRRAFARAVFGAKTVRELTAAQVRVVVEASKDPQGQRELVALCDFLIANDASLADIAKKLGGSLTRAAAAL